MQIRRVRRASAPVCVAHGAPLEGCAVHVRAQAQVPTGIIDQQGQMLPPNKSVRVALQDKQNVYVLLQADEDDPALVRDRHALMNRQRVSLP